ncbi:PWI domain-containing protein [Daedaleopsis nitida]|nr:PWI domain-containing protein [Daedaleopsis nitida]
MADAGFFKGTSADQDRRFSDKELKLLKTMKFPPEFDKKVDMRKVNLSVIRPWIVKKVVELVGFEDEVVVEYAMGLLEDDSQPTPDPRKMQINLTGFLTNSTPAFMSALWSLLLEAQESPAGVPRTFVEEKKQEMRQARAGDTRAIEERDRRAQLDEIRANEREARGGGRGRGRGRGRGGRGGFDDDRGDRPRDGGWGARGGTAVSLLKKFPFPFSYPTPVPLTAARWTLPVPVSTAAFSASSQTFANSSFPVTFPFPFPAPQPAASAFPIPLSRALSRPPTTQPSSAQETFFFAFTFAQSQSTLQRWRIWQTEKSEQEPFSYATPAAQPQHGQGSQSAPAQAKSPDQEGQDVESGQHQESHHGQS